MTTVTPLDLTPFGAVLTGIGLLYWLLILAGVGLALWLPKRWWSKIFCAIAVLVLFMYPVARSVKEDRSERQVAKAKFDTANARFQELCKGAGEKINRVVTT